MRVEQNYGGFIPHPEKQFRYSVIQVVIWSTLILLGILLKLQHWPGNALSILVGSGGLGGYNFVALLLQRGKHVLNTVLVVVTGLWIAILLWGLTMNNGHPYNGYGIMIYFGVLIVTGAINALVYRKYFNRTV